MKNFTKLFLLLAFLFSNICKATHLGNQILLSARMNGSQEVPAVVTNAVGVAAFSLNASRDTMCINLTVTGLSGPIIGAHIHSGIAGTNGSVIYDLTSSFTGNTASATLTGNDITSTLVSEYLQGMMYVNVHTAANPNGEIRGQVIQESDIQFIADLNGAQQNPPVATAAFGLGTFALSKHNGKMLVRVVADGLSGAIMGAHLHAGSMGTNGPVAIDLTSSINGNTIIASVDPTSILSDLMAGNIYINLHTSANPNGEIRGQLIMDNRLPFDALINGDQEVPPVTTSAMGLADIKLNTTFDTLWYDVVATGLSAAASGAHFHNGVPGVSGSVVYDISNDINGNRITGMATGNDVALLIEDLLRGNLYINIHNSNNPGGEIRGQVYRLLREGYTALIEGLQQVPPVVTSAHGTLVASVDRNQTDLHFMVVADGLMPNGVHFHNGADGQNGPVVFDITSMFTNNGAFGYWKSTDASPFTTANSLMFRNDSVYINLHTAANPNGEIRGQAERGYYCATITAVSEASAMFENATAFPNPVIKTFYLSFHSSMNEKIDIVISDAAGRELYHDRTSVHKGENKLSINAEELQQGIYFISLKNNYTEINTRFIKE